MMIPHRFHLFWPNGVLEIRFQRFCLTKSKLCKKKLPPPPQKKNHCGPGHLTTGDHDLKKINQHYIAHYISTHVSPFLGKWGFEKNILKDFRLQIPK